LAQYRNPAAFLLLYLLDECSLYKKTGAVDWMAKASSINFRQKKSFVSSAKHQDASDTIPVSCSVCTQGKAAVPRRKPLVSV
jgi:hypothetical protein